MEKAAIQLAGQVTPANSKTSKTLKQADRNAAYLRRQMREIFNGDGSMRDVRDSRLSMSAPVLGQEKSQADTDKQARIRKAAI